MTEQNDLARAARECVTVLRRRARQLRQAGHDGQAAWMDLEANRLEVPLRALEVAEQRGAEEAQAARLHRSPEEPR